MYINKKILLLLLVLVVIISGGIYFTINQFKSNDFENLNTNLLQIQAKIKNIKEKTLVEENKELLIGQAVPEELLTRFNLSDSESLRILSNGDLNELGLSNIDADMKYIVDYESGEIYYVDGFQDKNGQTYHKLSEMNTITQE